MNIQIAADGTQADGTGKSHVNKLFGYKEPMLCGTFDGDAKLDQVRAEQQQALSLTANVTEKKVQRGKSFYIDVTVMSSYDGTNEIHFIDCTKKVNWGYNTPFLVSGDYGSCRANVGQSFALTKGQPLSFHSKVDVKRNAPLGVLSFSVTHKDECGHRCKIARELISPPVKIEIVE